jgi:hypothetical protein
MLLLFSEIDLHFYATIAQLAPIFASCVNFYHNTKVTINHLTDRSDKKL